MNRGAGVVSLSLSMFVANTAGETQCRFGRTSQSEAVVFSISLSLDAGKACVSHIWQGSPNFI